MGKRFSQDLTLQSVPKSFSKFTVNFNTKKILKLPLKIKLELSWWLETPLKGMARQFFKPKNNLIQGVV
ncbi:hypothetical protein Lal_00026397 [Lupinus albus]|nr:hypothetical protein Lal_00026397 [Lupinus albus]